MLDWLLLSNDDFNARFEDHRKRVEKLEEEAQVTDDFTSAYDANSWLGIMQDIRKVRWKLVNAGWQPPK